MRTPPTHHLFAALTNRLPRLPDSVVLFTDGLPTKSDSLPYDGEVGQEQTRIRTQINQAEQEADRKRRETDSEKFRIFSKLNLFIRAPTSSCDPGTSSLETSCERRDRGKPCSDLGLPGLGPGAGTK